MTTLLQLKQGDSGTTLVLNSSGSTGFKLTEDGWDPVVATPVHMSDPPPVLETLYLLLSNTSHDNIATSMQSLHEMQVLANRYINDPTQEDPVWLHAQMDSETNVRRALVRSIEVQYKPTWYGVGHDTLNVPLVITVVREPYWERTTARDLDGVTPSAAAVVRYDYTNSPSHDIVGDVGSRIRHFRLQGGTGEVLKRFWIGIRSENKHPNITNFAEIWECEDGYNYTDASDTVDATASGGDRVTIAESGVDWDDGDFHIAMELRLGDTEPTYADDNLGKFLWLLRARTESASETWQVKLRFSYGVSQSEQTEGYIDTEPVEILSNSWDFYEMGVMPIGLRDYQSIIAADTALTQAVNFRVDIYAKRTTGSNDLWLDCICPIPVDEGFCKIVGKATLGTDRTSFGFSPKNSVDIIVESNVGTIESSAGEINPENFVLPPGDGRMFIAYADDDVSVIDDTVTINDSDVGRYYERWLSLRGSE